jgi:nucleoside-diphosphate-sugar epimerase
MKVLVTGANGFVGQALCARLDQAGHQVVPCVRRPGGMSDEKVVGDIDGATRWTEAVEGCQTVVHLAARVHVMHDKAADPLDEFRRANVVGTLNLARQAAAAGVRRFVFISSIKVNGESTTPGHPFTERDAPAPQDAYGVSKSEAEQGLQALARETGIELVIIRPPLVYGPGVRANFLALVRAVARGLPLPLAAVDNRRSLVGLDNLVDFIRVCLTHPAAAGQVFLVSDGEDLSTPGLIRGIARALGRPPRLLALPVWMLKIPAVLLGRRATLDRVCGDLQVDITKARTILGWRPPVSVSEGLAQVVRDLPSS